MPTTTGYGRCTWQWIWRLGRQGSNSSLPFDQFQRSQQLAGDLLPNATVDQKVASGFNRNHLLNGEGGAIAEEQRFVILFDRIDTTATTWLGLTMACAGRHDHKYDPITQRDYYSLMDAFNRVPESGTPQRFSNRIRIGAPFVELPTDENKAEIAKLEKKLAEIEKPKKIVDEGLLKLAYEHLVAPARTREVQALQKTLAVEMARWTATTRRRHWCRAFANSSTRKIRPDAIDKMSAVLKSSELKRSLDEYKKDQVPRVAGHER